MNRIYIVFRGRRASAGEYQVDADGITGSFSLEMHHILIGMH